MKFSDFLKNKQPDNWQPNDRFKVLHVEKTYKVNTPSGSKDLHLIYFLVRYVPGYGIGKNEYEDPQILDVYPIAQFDEDYIKSSVLTGPSYSLSEKDKVNWAWREYSSNHNHFHLLSEDIKNQIIIECEKKAENVLQEPDEYESWEDPDDEYNP